MMPGFLKSVAFAAIAGLVAVVWLMLFGPGLGWGIALGGFALVAVVAYAATIAGTWPQRARVLAIGGVVALPLVFLLPSATLRLVAAAALLAVVRSVFLYPGRKARAVVIELVLALGGLLLVRLLEPSTVLEMGLAVWGYFLLQSGFFLVVHEAEAREEPASDRFEQAKARMLEILEEPAARH